MNRPTEIALALALAVVLLPVMLLIALLVRLALGRPVIHRSMRAGVRGRRFELIKFRTMPPGAGGGVTGGHKLAKVGRIGRMLRDSRLDELPQIFNIMSGDMSFVGPRPPLPEYADGSRCLWQGKAPGRPGVTGLATLVFHAREEALLAACATPLETEQVYARRCIARKDRIDRIYARRRTVARDLWIMALTALRVLQIGQGRRLGRPRPGPANRRPARRTVSAGTAPGRMR